MDARARDELSCTTREAAEALGICVRTAQLWVEQGRLLAWKTPGGHRRILCESVSAQLRLRKTKGGIPLDAFAVLIVDNERSQRQLLQAKIGEISPEISVRTADSGVDALLKVGELHAHVLITELIMPGIDGFSLLEALNSSPLLCPLQIIVTTRLNNGEISAQGGLPGGAAIFHKPIQIPLLVAMVRACHEGWLKLRKTPQRAIRHSADPLSTGGQKSVYSDRGGGEA